MSATHYLGLFAKFYDLFYAAKPYAQEAAFVAECLETHGGGRRILELACGTGGHAFALEKLGYDVSATDYSVDMLALAEEKKSRLGSKVRFFTADMRALDIRGEPFDAVISLFDSIGYVLTNDALLDTLRGVNRQLRPGGLFLFEFWHGPAMLRHYDPVRVRQWPLPGGKVQRISETTVDVGRQISTVRYQIYHLNDDGTYRAFAESHSNRFFSVPEMAGWLGQTGFTPLCWHAGFAPDTTITDNTWHVLGVARKSEKCYREGHRP
jgi:SAM-dependent methyltransferase